MYNIQMPSLFDFKDQKIKINSIELIINT